jgi:RecA-family ATPase
MIVSGKELIEMGHKDYPVLVEGLIPKYDLTCLAGGSDAGKSSILRDLAMSIVEKQDSFLGQKLNITHGRVIYVSSEDGIYGLSNCLIRSTAGNDSDVYDNITFILEAENVLNIIKEELSKYKVDAVIIDAYSDVFIDGNMNSANDTRKFLNSYDKIIKEHECCVIFLHHFGKSRDEAGGSNKHALLGSCGMEQKMRAVLTLKKGNTDGVRELRLTKGNNFTADEKKVIYNLNFGKNQRFTLIDKSSEPQSRLKREQEDKDDVIMLVHELREKGRSWKDVEQEVRAKGYNYGKTKLTDWYKEYKAA